MNRIWQDAFSILETAGVHNDSQPSEFAILVDDRNGMRIVNCTGWQLEALRTEYRATTAFLVRRTPDSVSVQAQNGSERCDLRQSGGKGVLADFTGGAVAHHLIRREPLALTAGDVAGCLSGTSARVAIEGYGNSRNTRSSFQTRDGSALKSGDVNGSFMNSL
jgi:hypothetical protein